MARPITFLSDYGYDDEFAGVCRAVIARIAPEARVVDLTHGIARHDIRQGAAVLANALPFAPPGVHLAVVDPEVGTERRAVAIRVADEDRVLVGPDNGLLWPAIERLGGPREAADVSLSSFRLEPLSATFHGRDVFAPVAATLAQGATLREVGTPLAPDALTRLESSQARIEDGRTLARVAYLDGYGNAVLDLARGAAARDRAAGSATRWSSRASPGAPRRSSPAPSPTSARGGCCSTSIPTGASLWRSTAAARQPSCAWSRPARSSCAPVSNDRLRLAAPSLSGHRLYQRARPRAGDPGRARRHCRHGRGADVRPRPPGALLGDAARQGALVLGDPAPAGQRARPAATRCAAGRAARPLRRWPRWSVS